MEKLSLTSKSGANIVLGFSSYNVMQKFYYTYEAEVSKANEKIMKVYRGMFKIDLDVLALIRYYMKVERRMFHIEYEGETYKCLNDVQFHLSFLTKSNN